MPPGSIVATAVREVRRPRQRLRQRRDVVDDPERHEQVGGGDAPGDGDRDDHHLRQDRSDEQRTQRRCHRSTVGTGRRKPSRFRARGRMDRPGSGKNDPVSRPSTAPF